MAAEVELVCGAEVLGGKVCTVQPLLTNGEVASHEYGRESGGNGGRLLEEGS